MNLLDALIPAILAVNVGLGFKWGVVRRVVAFAGVFAGVGAATLVAASASTRLAATFSWSSALWAHVVTYAVIVIGSLVLFEILGAVYARTIEFLVAPLFDAAAGGVAGAALGVIEVSLFLYLGINLLNSPLPSGYAYPPSFVKAQELIMGSWFAPHFYALFPLTKTIFSAVLPSSIGGYFFQLLQVS
jgi:uncharacterized membrane protein required for colicin V production